MILSFLDGVFFERTIRWVVCLSVFTSSSISSAQDTFKILNYNVWGAPIASKATSERLVRITERIKSSDYDIIALQEAFRGCLSNSSPRSIASGSNYPFYIASGLPYRFGKCVNSGLVILSKHPILMTHQMAFQGCSHSDCLSQKGVLHARIQTPKFGDIDVYVTHLNANPRLSWIRTKQLKQSVEFIKKHSGSSSRPILFMGDFNATPDSHEMMDLLKELELTDAHAEFVRQSMPPSDEALGWTVNPLQNGNLKPGSPSARIDYVLIRVPSPAGRFKHSSLNVRAKLAFTEKELFGKPLSDHFGVHVELD